MTTKVVDELVVTLDLDPTKFNKKIEQILESLKMVEKAAVGVGTALSGKTAPALETTGVQGERAGSRIGGGFRGAAMVVAALDAAVYKLNQTLGLPAFRRITQEVIDAETATVRLGETLKVNTTDLQAWQKVITLHGGDGQKFGNELEKVAANIGKIGTNVRGAKLLKDYLGLAGVTEGMAKGKNALDFLKLYAEQVDKMTPERQLLVGRRLGLSDAAIRTFQDSGPILAAQLAQMKELSATNEELQNSRNVAETQAMANLQWERAKQVLAVALLPAMQRLANMLQAASKWAREHASAVQTGLAIMGGALAAFAVIAAAASIALLAAGIQWATAMNLITGGTWMIGVAAGMAALAGIATTAGILASKFDEVTQSHEQMVHEVTHGADEVNSANRAWKEYTDTIDKLNAKIKELKNEEDRLRGEGARWAGLGRGSKEATAQADDRKQQREILEQRLGIYMGASPAGQGYLQMIAEAAKARVQNEQKELVERAANPRGMFGPSPEQMRGMGVTNVEVHKIEVNVPAGSDGVQVGQAVGDGLRRSFEGQGKQRQIDAGMR